MSNKNILIKNFLSLISLRGLELLIPLLTMPYLLRTIGVEKYGLVSFGYAFANYFGAIIQYGFSVTATRDIARNRHDAIAINRLYSNFLASSGLLALVAITTALLLLLVFTQLRSAWPLLLLSLSQVILQSIFPVWFFQGIERMAFIAYLNLGSKLIFIAGIILLIHGPEDYLYLPILNLFSAAMMLICSMWIISRKFKVQISKPAWSSLRETLFNGRHAFINQLAPNLYNNSTTFLLGLLSGGYGVGIYSVVTKVIDVASSVGYIISNTFLPHLSLSIRNHEIFKKVMLTLGLFGTICIVAGANLIGRLLHPTDGPAIAELLRMASISVFMIFAMLTFGTNYLMLVQRESIAGRVSLITSLAFFVVALILVPNFGVVGGVVTLIGARTCMAAALYINYRRMNRKKINEST